VYLVTSKGLSLHTEVGYKILYVNYRYNAFFLIVVNKLTIVDKQYENLLGVSINCLYIDKLSEITRECLYTYE